MNIYVLCYFYFDGGWCTDIKGVYKNEEDAEIDKNYLMKKWNCGTGIIDDKYFIEKHFLLSRTIQEDITNETTTIIK